jgi:hypothetical protein
MRQLLLCAGLVFMLIFSVPAGAQIQNSGFESWTSGNPNDWFGNNAATLYTPITQTSDAHSGSSALKGTVVTYNSIPVSPLVLAGTTGQGFTAGARYSSVTGYFKFSPVGGDTFYVVLVADKGGVPIGGGVFRTGASVSAYTQFTAPIYYSTGDAPDIISIEFVIVPGATLAHTGSSFEIDDIAYGTVTSVPESGSQQPAVFSLEQNYPNPFNPSTMIQFTVPSTGRAALKVFNVLGQEVATLFDGEASAGVSHQVEFNASSLASGIYFSRLEFDGKTEMKKMMMVK